MLASMATPDNSIVARIHRTLLLLLLCGAGVAAVFGMLLRSDLLVRTAVICLVMFALMSLRDWFGRNTLRR
jgi:hypothetical protein